MCCVMLVEDDRFIAMALQIRLKAQGYEVLLADGLESARFQLAKKSIDLAVVDVNLIDGCGFDLIPELRDEQSDTIIPAIVVSAGNKRGLREKAMAHGAHTFLEKPFRSVDLLAVMESAIPKSTACRY